MKGDKKMISDAQKRRTAKYKKANYARLELTIKKDFKADIQQARSKAGQSVNQYILQAVNARMLTEHATTPAEQQPAPPEQQQKA